MTAREAPGPTEHLEEPPRPGAPGRTPIARAVGASTPTLVGLVVAVALLVEHGSVSAWEWVRAGLIASFALAGSALLCRRQTARIGWIVAAAAAVAASWFLAASLLTRGELVRGATVAEATTAGLVAAAAFHVLLALPDGVLGSRARRNAALAGYLAAATIGILRWAARPDPPRWPLLVLGVVLAAGGLAAGHLRYVSTRGAARHRMQWLGVGLALTAEVVILVGALHLLLGWPGHAGEVITASFALVAASFAAGASRRLVDKVERLLHRAVAVGGLSAMVVGLYLLIVVGIGRVPTDTERPILLLSMIAAGATGALYLPTRDRLAEVANRVVYQQDRDPTEVLVTFGERMTRAVPMDDLLLQLAGLLHRHLDLAQAEVWTGPDGALSRSAAVPHRGRASLTLGEQELAVVSRAGVSGRTFVTVWLRPLLHQLGDGPVRVAPMTHAGELWGLIVVERLPGDDDFSDEDERVLTELARQVGLAVRNAELDSALKTTLEELRAQAVELQGSRARIVATGDAERRRIERDLHDGAQQHLVALAVKLRLVEALARRDDIDAAVELLEEARHDVTATVDELRRLAHGIYPPLLLDQGLAEALRAVAGRAPLPTRVTISGQVSRHPQDLESAVYFCCLEALQNAGKHAGAGATATVTIEEIGGSLRFEVADDGVGFDPAEGSGGHGFVNMGDRLGAVGGTVEVRSRPGHGTRVIGTVPVARTDRTG